ncbi:hypothetical protein DH86_00001020 [Scytalidium sp. 3C]|nr:hypothetical protein DH86_00001020 [Scytalidium sp. 3C]
MLVSNQPNLIRTVDLPLPTARLANAAMRALAVDEELSPLVRRSFSVVPSSVSAHLVAQDDESVVREEEPTVLRTQYKATTNRMLRVAVNGFMESLSVVIGVMAELDVDVLEPQLEGNKSLEVSS